MRQPLSINVSRETWEQLRRYIALLQKWQPRINLIGPATLDQLWDRHITDSLQLITLLPAHASRLVDFGSGGGLPGIPLAVARPGLEVTLIESDKRKAVFLQEVARTLGLNVTVWCRRIENPPHPLSTYDIITARACAPLGQLWHWSQPYLSPDGVCLFAKGRSYRKELAEAKKAAMFACIVHRSQTDPASAILQLSHSRKDGGDDTYSGRREPERRRG